MTKLLARCKEPLTADGIVELVRSGRVRVVGAVSCLDAAGVRLVTGLQVEADDVVAATGLHPVLDPLVGHLDVLDNHGRPVSATARPTLGFVGYRIPLTGTLWAIDRDARRVADALASRTRSNRAKTGVGGKESGRPVSAIDFVD